MEAFWILFTLLLLGSACAAIGTFLVLRQQSLMADALSHAVLPGIVIAFLWSGIYGGLLTWFAALITGLITTTLILWIQRHQSLHQDSVIGLVFSFLFALGILLLSAFARKIDLDQECVLYGEIAYLPFSPFIADLIPVQSVKVLFMAILVFLIVFLGWRGFSLFAFDPAFAHSLGFDPKRWEQLLLLLTTILVITAFEIVGVILVLAYLIIAPATAWLTSQRLTIMVGKAILYSISATFLGYFIAVFLDVSIAGAIGGVSFLQLCFIALYKVLRRRLRQASYLERF